MYISLLRLFHYHIYMNLILIYGPPAAGKLTVANQLAKLTGYNVIDNHKATDYLQELFPRSNPAYDPIRTPLSRKIRLMTYEAAARAGVDLITTFAPLAEGGNKYIKEIIDGVTDAGGKVSVVQLLPSVEALEQRVVGESRKGIKAETVERLHELIDDHPGMFATYPEDHLVIDNSDLSPDDTARLIIEYFHLS